MITLDVVPDPGALESLRHSWDELFKSGRFEPSVSYEWTEALVRNRINDEISSGFCDKDAVRSGVNHPGVYNALAWRMVELGQGDPNAAVAYAERIAGDATREPGHTRHARLGPLSCRPRRCRGASSRRRAAS